jgi:hypothetical protein
MQVICALPRSLMRLQLENVGEVSASIDRRTDRSRHGHLLSWYPLSRYRRFSPTILEKVGEAGFAGFGERLHRCVENLEPDNTWDTEVLQHEIQVPKSLRPVMCDVDCGSQTPGMAKNVLEWRKAKPGEAALLWNALQRGT